MFQTEVKAVVDIFLEQCDCENPACPRNFAKCKEPMDVNMNIFMLYRCLAETKAHMIAELCDCIASGDAEYLERVNQKVHAQAQQATINFAAMDALVMVVMRTKPEGSAQEHLKRIRKEAHHVVMDKMKIEITGIGENSLKH